MKKPLILDTECTGATNDTKGNPFTISNRLCFIGYIFNHAFYGLDIDYSFQPYGHNLRLVQRDISQAEILVGFNLKYDLHWLRRYDIIEFQKKKIWDCQTFEYIISRQKNAYPSLEETAQTYGFGGKLDIVRTEYWEKGLDTDEIPENILRDYLQQDVNLTAKIYEKQLEIYKTLPEDLQKLIILCMQDILILEEMEWNGLSYDIKNSLLKSQECEGELRRLDRALSDLTGYSFVNWNSGDHLSAVLFGGCIKETFRELFTFVYKDGSTKEKERWAIRRHQLDRLVEPLSKTGLKKEGYYKTDEEVLKKLSKNKKVSKIIELLLKRTKIEKLRGTYFEGFPKLHKKMEWEDGILHGQFNQCVTLTGRLASQKPNEQNLPDEARELVVSRFE